MCSLIWLSAWISDTSLDSLITSPNPDLYLAGGSLSCQYDITCGLWAFHVNMTLPVSSGALSLPLCEKLLNVSAQSHSEDVHRCLYLWQGTKVRLETSNAALLEVTSRSWDEAMSDEGRWHLVDLLLPDTPPA